MIFNTKTKIFLTVVFVAIGIISRFLPHTWNFTPVIAIVIFTSTYLGLRYSFVTLLGVMAVSDMFIGFYDWHIMFAVYGSLALAGLVGVLMKRKVTVASVFVGTIGSSLIFFIITNWAVWQFGTMYQHSLSGLTQSYIIALPFFRNSFFGDIFYSGVLFGVFEMCSYFFASRNRVEKVGTRLILG